MTAAERTSVVQCPESNERVRSNTKYSLREHIVTQPKHPLSTRTWHIQDDEEGSAVGANELASSDVVDYDGDGDINATTMTVQDIEHGAEDVIDFIDDDDDDEDDDDDNNNNHPGTGDAKSGGAAGGQKNASTGVSTPPLPPPQQRRIARPGEHQEDKTGAGDEHRSTAEHGFLDFGGGEFCGDLMDQMSELHPDQEELPFKIHGEDWEDDDDEDDFFPAAADGFRRRNGGGGEGGQMRGSRRRGGGHRGRPGGRRSVYADLVMPYGDPQEEGGQGIVSIPVKITSVPENDDDDDDNDSGGSGGGARSA